MSKETIAIIFEHKKIERNLWSLIPKEYVIGCLEKSRFNKNIIVVNGTKQYNCVNKKNCFSNSFGYPLSITDYDFEIEKKAQNYFNSVIQNKYFEIINSDGKKNFYRVNSSGELLTTKVDTWYKNPSICEKLLLNNLGSNLENITVQEFLNAEFLNNQGLEQKDIQRILMKQTNDELVIKDNFKEKYDNVLNINKSYNKMKETIISQDEAIKEVLLTIRNNLQKMELNYPINNILLIGPSGVGKTLIAQEISKLLGVPFTIVDANNLTQMGYVGSNVFDCLATLYIKSNGNIKLAQKGVVFVDEIDKLVSNDTSEHVKTIGVQDALLKLLEGQEYDLKIGGKTVVFDSTNITFIAGGAFDKLTSYNITKGIGFNSMLEQRERKVNGYDNIELLLNKYGFKHELIGRLQKIILLNDLKVDDIKKIIISPHSIFNYYLDLFKQYEINFVYDDSFIENLAKYSIEKFGGARGIFKALEKVFDECLWEIYTHEEKFSELIVDGEMVYNPKKYILR